MAQLSQAEQIQAVEESMAADRALVDDILERAVMGNLEGMAENQLAVDRIWKRVVKPYAKQMRANNLAVNEVVQNAVQAVLAQLGANIGDVSRISATDCRPQDLPPAPPGWMWTCQPTA